MRVRTGRRIHRFVASEGMVELSDGHDCLFLPDADFTMLDCPPTAPDDDGADDDHDFGDAPAMDADVMTINSNAVQGLLQPGPPPF